MRVYGLSYLQTMQLPIPAFWHISGTVPRLLAGERKETLELLTTAAHNPAQSAELYTRLADLSPEPIVVTGRALAEATAIRDEAGFNELRSLAG